MEGRCFLESLFFKLTYFIWQVACPSLVYPLPSPLQVQKLLQQVVSPSTDIWCPGASSQTTSKTSLTWATWPSRVQHGCRSGSSELGAPEQPELQVWLWFLKIPMQSSAVGIGLIPWLLYPGLASQESWSSRGSSYFLELAVLPGEKKKKQLDSLWWVAPGISSCAPQAVLGKVRMLVMAFSGY